MPRKNIELSLEIEIKSVSCPGVWICPKGRVSLSVVTLGLAFQTAQLPPLFPLHFNEIFYFRKIFQNVYHLTMLQAALGNELLYCELIQWPTGSCFEQRRVLAKYVGVLEDVLYPSALYNRSTVDLLMKTCPIFPGILSPIIEMTTKTRIDEVFNRPSSLSKSNIKNVNSDIGKTELRRQMQVCHMPQYSKGNISQFNKVNDYSSEVLSMKCELRQCEICQKYKELFDGIPIRSECCTCLGNI